MSNFDLLATLGWQHFFHQQLTLDELESAMIGRVVEQHRSKLYIATGADPIQIDVLHSMPPITVGDWIVLDDQHRFQRLLERKTSLQRKAAGAKVGSQLIAANIDTAFIVCSMNEDFNLNRIERYLALVNEAGIEPIIVLSKRDLVSDPEDYVATVQRSNPELLVEEINGLDAGSVAKLSAWLRKGNTACVLGSSGVGKSTLVNALLDDHRQATGEIREADAKGRHVTTSRSLFSLQNGALILDTPGMRELQLFDNQEGIEATFSDILMLARECRFKDCCHHLEPDCAVRAAVEQGNLESRRLESYLKLLRETELNTATMAEKRAKDKALSKYYKQTIKESAKLNMKPRTR